MERKRKTNKMSIEGIIAQLKENFGNSFDDYTNENVKIIIGLLNEIKYDEENDIW